MSITNISKPSTSLSNKSQPNRGETWGSITTTWATETRTWNQASKLITNIGTPLFSFLLREDGGLLLLESSDRIQIYASSFITNVTKP